MLIVDKLALQEKLSEGEKTLAAYILAHGMEIAKYSTRSLAEVTYTSPPTVLRLCKNWAFPALTTSSRTLCASWNILTSGRARWTSIFPLRKPTVPCG